MKNNAESILVVDDTMINRLATAVTVRLLNYAVDEADSGQAALDKLKTGGYAAVLMDVQMPGMNGFECTQKIRATESASSRQIPIIGLTNSAEIGIEQKCLESGMDAYLAKDCSSEQLNQILKKYTPRLLA